MSDIAGICDPKFAKVKDIMAASIERGDDVGVSFAVTIGGEMVVDLWGGHLDASAADPWLEDTLVNYTAPPRQCRSFVRWF